MYLNQPSKLGLKKIFFHMRAYEKEKGKYLILTLKRYRSSTMHIFYCVSIKKFRISFTFEKCVFLQKSVY